MFGLNVGMRALSLSMNFNFAVFFDENRASPVFVSENYNDFLSFEGV